MTKKILLLSLALLILFTIAQAQDENTREVFKRTRKPATEQSSPPSEKDSLHSNRIKTQPITSPQVSASRPKTQPKTQPKGKNSVASNQMQDMNRTKVESIKAIDDSSSSNMGLGYTLFLDEGSGILSSVDSQQVFHTGQSVRLLLESNIDGYLYIFHQENGGKVNMLLPSWQDGRGENYIHAHKPVIIPAENKITFTGKPAEETLTIVVSRTPIPELPMGEKLMGAGSVVVPPALFQRLSQPCVCREDKDDTQKVQKKNDIVARDMTLTKSDPLPSYILLNQDKKADLLTMRIKFTHR